MYFVDRSKVEETIVFIDTLLADFEPCSCDSLKDRLYIERLTHLLIESILDVGNMMIDGFIMRDPGSYEDIIDILVDGKVLLADEEDAYKHVIRLRESIVRNYLNIDHQQLMETVTDNKQVLTSFSRRIRDYLEQELGVAHAFSNEE